MSGFLIDVNLPRNIDIWQTEAFEYVVDLDRTMKDSRIWDYARDNKLTILTKDSDFSDRVLISEPPPRVIHFRTGNMRLRDFKQFITHNWSTIEGNSVQNRLVSVSLDQIETLE